jgi:CubicO group peptidase (beta-lactamase class C family)
MKKIFSLFILLISIAAKTQSWQDTVKMIDKIMDRYKPVMPGAQMAISRNGQLIYSGVRGLADLERNVPLTKESKTEAGSVSKQFTAAAILVLEQQGKLSVHDDIRKYLPEIPDYGNTIRIYHLLHHTSGLKDWGSVIALSGWPRGTRAYTNEDALQIIARQKSLNNLPGAEYIYSNSNYTCLTIIVQRVSSLSHAAFTKKYLFEPAGMKNTEWRGDFRRVVPGRAIAYSLQDSVYEITMPNEDTHGHGGLLTTAEDLLKWNQFYLSGKLGNPSLLPKQIEIRPLNNGKKNAYAAGLDVDSINGWRAISHTGATAGYRAQLEYFPDFGLSFAWLSNNAASVTASVPDDVRDIFVKDISPAAGSGNLKPDSSISWKKFIIYAGAYSNLQTGSGFTLYSKENGMYVVPAGGPLQPLNENTLAVGRGRLIFQENNQRMVMLINAGGDTVLFYKTDTARTDSASLQEYAGKYFSDETESYMYVEVKNGKLLMYPRKGMEEEATFTYRDGVYYPGAEIAFQRNKKGIITHFFVNVSRARKVAFKKVLKE